MSGKPRRSNGKNNSLQGGSLLRRTFILLTLQARSTRKVPGRGGMTYEEEDWVDQDATASRAR